MTTSAMKVPCDQVGPGTGGVICGIFFGLIVGAMMGIVLWPLVKAEYTKIATGKAAEVSSEFQQNEDKKLAL